MSDFSRFFKVLTGNNPFPWQERLSERFAAGELPAACDIPTGLGKTSVMAIWLAALDCRPDAAIRLPRRLIYVVDRRAVVDQATDEALKLRQALGGSELAPLRAQLQLGERALPVSTLRGQFADNREWLGDPTLPAIVVGTVDMIGSRLLFQGYGVSRRARPIHAAFIGDDALIVLDEAHLVPPFQALVTQVAEMARADQEGSSLPVTPMRLLTLSATGRGAEGEVEVFKLSQNPEDEGPEVAKRLAAGKWVRIEPEVANTELAATLAERAWALGAEAGTPQKIIVFCNSNRVARDVHETLEAKLKALLKERGEKKPDTGRHIELIVGARRVFEREEMAASLVFRRFARKLQPEEAAEPLAVPAFIVATSAGEVGIDLDADHMVADLVPWERMVQRLGRVNRRGDLPDGSTVDIFPSPAERKKDKELEIDAPDAKLAAWRRPFLHERWVKGEDGRLNASPGALQALRGAYGFPEAVEVATTRPPLRPALGRPEIDAWSMTSLRVHTGRPEVAPWLRGWVEEDGQARIVWRTMLPLRADEHGDTARRQLEAFLERAPPHASEVLETYDWAVAGLLKARTKALLKDAAEPEPEDAEEAQAENGRHLGPTTVVALSISDDGGVERLWTLSDLESADTNRLTSDVTGRTVIVDAGLGGLGSGGLLDQKTAAAPPTLDSGRTADGGPGWNDERLERIGFRVRIAAHAADPTDGWAVVWRRFLSAADEENSNVEGKEWRVEAWTAGLTDERTALARQDQLLTGHHEAAGRHAKAIADGLGLPEWLTSVLVLAAGVHDLGKARAIWQAFAGKPGFARLFRVDRDAAMSKALAKFKTRGNPALLRIGEDTYRHEFGSLRDVIEEGTFDALDPDSRDLALHLIAAHHGEGRPFLTPLDEGLLDEVTTPVAREAMLRFTRLQRRWGPWGLAWLESLLRAADVAASRELDEAPAKHAAAGATRPEAA